MEVSGEINGGVEIKKNRGGGAGNSASAFLLPRPTRGTSPDVPFIVRLLVGRRSSSILRRSLPPSKLICFASRRYIEAKKTADPAAVAITINAIIMTRRPLPPAQPRAARGMRLPQPSVLAVVCVVVFVVYSMI